MATILVAHAPSHHFSYGSIPNEENIDSTFDERYQLSTTASTMKLRPFLLLAALIAAATAAAAASTGNDDTATDAVIESLVNQKGGSPVSIGDL